MSLDSILSWMLYGVWVATNHFSIGAALICYGKCFESEDDPTSHPHFIGSLGENAPRCTNASDRRMRISCHNGEDGCKKDFLRIQKPVPMEFILYGCDRSSVPAGWHNLTNRDYGPAYWKCTSELCNLPSDKYTQLSATGSSATQASYPPTTELPAFGRIGILLPITNAMNFNWTAFIDTIKSFKF